MSTDPDPADAAEPPPDAPTVVGIGASAGGLAALKAFFGRVPEDTGLVFVVVVHLSPEHESHLAELLQPHARVPVQQVTETTPLEADRVYVIPPGRNLTAVDTHLRLTPLEEQRRERAPIDHFFRTLARTHDGHSIGIVLTGTGSDGTLGIQAIKERSGLVVVQDPNEAEYDGMPQSAVASGVVDWVLPLAEIPDAIVQYAHTEPRVAVPTEGEDLDGEERQRLQKVFAQIRSRTGRDFSRYKRSTILRRITRRMQLRHLEELEDYLGVLREDPEEVRDLADDLLINVTSFFRDPEVFEKLAQDVVPALFTDRSPDDPVRVWSVGCATGEEAYSLAMLLIEEAGRHDVAPPVQVFASDLHERSLGRARDGFYPGDVETDVSPDRLRRFFCKEDGGYRVRKEVREAVVFAPHNLLSDPPFSKLDLVSCRNLLIYLQRPAQRDVVELFHYALRPGGALVLGTSETADAPDLFKVEDKRLCLYRRRDVPAPEPRLPVFPLAHARLPSPPRGEPAGGRSYGALHERVVERYGPPSLLLGPDDRVVHVSESAGRYLTHPGGEITANALRLVRPELRVELRAALHAARERGEPVRTRAVAVQTDGETRPVRLDVRPASGDADGHVLVLFDERAPLAGEPDADLAAAGADLAGIEAERDWARQRLQALVEEYETGQEEMKASNEELQSTNEELRSTLEELETSKEELQSMNEELQTVNQENRHKVEELAQLSGDLQNLMAATDIATLFLDRDLRILRFTPRVAELFNVRLADRGRPLSDFTHRLGTDALAADAERVLARLVPVEREVPDDDGRWYLMRVLPYRSAEDRIEGVVITFVEITARKEAEDRLCRAVAETQQQARFLDATLSNVFDYVYVWDLDGRLVWANQRLEELWGRRASEYVGRTNAELGDPLGQGGWPLAEIGSVVETGRNATGEVPVERPGGELGTYEYVLTPIRNADGEVDLVAGVSRDVTEQRAAEAAARESEGRLREIAETVPDVLFTARPEGRVDYVNPRFEALTGHAPAAVVGTELWPGLIHPDDRERVRVAWDDARAREVPFEVRHRMETAEDGVLWVITRARPVRDDNGAVTSWVGAVTDVDELTRAEAEVRDLNASLEGRVAERTVMVRQLAAALTVAEQEERQRIAHVLHDDLQQQLHGLSMLLGVARKAGGTDAGPLLTRAAEVLDDAVTLTRTLSTDLNPAILDSDRLEDGLAWLADQTRERHGLEVSVESEGETPVPEPAVRVLVYQVVRELLFNVVKHAGADRARVAVAGDGDDVVVRIEDDGSGFDPDDVADGFGLRSVRDRLELVGGRFEVDSEPGGGTRAEVVVPGRPLSGDA